MRRDPASVGVGQGSTDQIVRKMAQPHAARPAMYQLEVKRYLVEHQFPPIDGWEVTIDGGLRRDTLAVLVGGTTTVAPRAPAAS